jgi:hypothetical protein
MCPSGFLLFDRGGHGGRVEAAMRKRHSAESRWKERVEAAEREWRYSGWNGRDAPNWLEVLSIQKGPKGLTISGRLAPEGEPSIRPAAHSPSTGLPLLRVHAHYMYREAGESFDEACRLAACLELDHWIPDGPVARRYRQLRDSVMVEGSASGQSIGVPRKQWFARAVKLARGKLPFARADLRTEGLAAARGDATSDIKDEFDAATMPRDDSRSPHGQEQAQNRDVAQVPPDTDEEPDPEGTSVQIERMEFLTSVANLAAQVEAALKTVPKHGVGIPPFPFDGKHRSVIRDGKMVVEEVPLRTSLDECQDQAETHRYVRSLPLPPPCERTCMDGRAMSGQHGHCANCNAAVPAFAVVQFFDGSLPIPRFCCSDRCRTAIFEALRKEHEGGGCDRG